MALRKNLTVRGWLAALVAAAVVPTFAAAIAALVHSNHEEHEAIRRGLADTTRALAQVIDRELAQREAIVLTLAGSPTLTRGDLAAFYEYAKHIAPTRDRVVVLHALDGSQLVNTRVPFGEPLPTSTTLAPARAALGPTGTLVSNLYFAPVGKQHSFAVQVPVLREGRPIYYLSIAGFASALQSITESQRIPDGWIASIVDGNGVVVARTPSGPQFVGRRVSDTMLTHLARASEGAVESKSIDGIPILATYSKSPNYGWAVVVGVPIAQLPTPFMRVSTFAALGLLCFLAALTAAVVMAKRLIRPVERLKAATEAIGSGASLDLAPTGIAETDVVLAGIQAAKMRIEHATAALEARRAEAETAAQALRRSNLRVQLATDTAGLGLFTWQPERDHVEWHNTRLFQIFGIDPSQQPVNSAKFLRDYLHADDADAFHASVRSAIDAGEPLYFQGRIRRVDGQQRWIEVRGRVEHPDGGLELVGTVADVTDRLTAERALQESEERLRLLANSIPTLAWMASPSGEVTWYNDRWYAYTGSTLDEMRGDGWQKVHHPQTLPEVIRKWDESIRTGQMFEMPFVPLRGSDGVYHPFYTRVVPLRDADGRIIQWFGTNTDVSSLKEAEEKLLEADKRKDEFLAVLAHELRNPLAPIRTAAELLKRTASKDPQIGKASDIIARQARHMSGLLNDLLDVSRITRGLVRIDMSAVELDAIVANAMEQVRPNAEAKQQRIRLVAPAVAPTVWGNSLRLTQVVTNLLDNALKFSDEGAEIELGYGRTGERVHLWVADHGEGIPADLLPRVFDAFTQGDRGRHRPKGGLGLGLAVVRGLVELQGGTVQASSDGSGQGSRFDVFLVPAPQVVAPPSTDDAPALETTAQARPLNLLLVDDNEDGLEMLSTFLQEHGHWAQCATTPTQALALMEREPFDVAILDIGLPEMSGIELAALVRKKLPSIRSLIALSGYGQPHDLKASAEGGFAHHFVKPIDTDALLRLLGSIPR